jgi:hypothetical protein
MNIAKKAATQLLKTHKSVESVRTQMRTKLACLLESRPAYVLFDFGTTHPYYDLERTIEHFSDSFKNLSAALANLAVGSTTVGCELDKIVSGCDVEVDAKKFCLLQGSSVTSITALGVACLLEDVYTNAIFVRSYTDRKAIEAELLKTFEKKHVAMQLEKPYIRMDKECNAAFGDVKKLAKIVLDVKVNGMIIRHELGKKNTLDMLKSGQANFTIESLLKI